MLTGVHVLVHVGVGGCGCVMCEWMDGNCSAVLCLFMYIQSRQTLLQALNWWLKDLFFIDLRMAFVT
jgi:hypothetical protein